MLARFCLIITAVMLLTTPVISDEIKIASWNIEDFGPTKAGIKGRGNEDSKRFNVIGEIAKIIKELEVDLIVIQEVSDVQRKTLPKLSSILGEDWDYVESKTTGDEQYAIFFKPRKLRPKFHFGREIYLYNKCWYTDNMKRLPGYCGFETVDGSFDFIIVTFHNNTWDKGAEEQAQRLYNIYVRVYNRLGARDNDIILLGDFNIEDEYRRYFRNLLNVGIKNAIIFGTDTMLSKSNSSTVDNIFYRKDKDLEIEESGSVQCAFDDDKISDHYPVWATFKIPEFDDDK